MIVAEHARDMLGQDILARRAAAGGTDKGIEHAHGRSR